MAGLRSLSPSSPRSVTPCNPVNRSHGVCVVMTHLHCGELLCDDCALAIRAEIRADWSSKGESMTALDEQDSEVWPIVCDAGESDSPCHCAQGEKCKGAIQPSKFARPICRKRRGLK